MKQELFLAIPYERGSAVTPLFTLFTSNPLYLSIRTFKERTYLGKEIAPLLSYEQFVDQKNHLVSLLKRLFPESSFSNDSLLLISHVNF